MEINWTAMRTGGMPAVMDVLRQIEHAVTTNEMQIEALRLNLPIAQRLEPVWFRKYADLYGALIAAGMPADLDGEQVVTWLQSRLGSSCGTAIDARSMFVQVGDGTEMRPV